MLELAEKKETEMGGNGHDLLLVSAYTHGLGGITANAVLLVSSRNACAWEAHNGIWVWCQDQKYRPRWRRKNGPVWRAVGQPRKDRTWKVTKD